MSLRIKRAEVVTSDQLTLGYEKLSYKLSGLLPTWQINDRIWLDRNFYNG